MKATWNGVVIAHAPKEELISIESNWYFPPSAIDQALFTKNDDHTTCFWKGEASYYDVTVAGNVNRGAAWYYPEPLAGSVERVKHDFTNYVAFWRGVVVSE
ncbi:DUF427 domain-containing protein [Pedobacter sp.]|nr:DUF427 domain-containing protein [Candidatus Saccharibacteria bacterium]